jgi:hypothetical protein
MFFSLSLSLFIVLILGIDSLLPQRMREEGAKVTTSESLLFEILGELRYTQLHSKTIRNQISLLPITWPGSASHPQFKEISTLVKQWKAETSHSLSKLLDQ